MTITVHTDGGARGNPGPSAIGVVITGDTKELTRFGKTIGHATNNTAEYTAVIEALTWLKNNPITQSNNPTIQFFLDSNLVVNQLNGVFKIKDPNLRLLATKIKILEQEISAQITYTYVPREKNKEADLLVNQALDHNL